MSSLKNYGLSDGLFSKFFKSAMTIRASERVTSNAGRHIDETKHEPKPKDADRNEVEEATKAVAKQPDTVQEDSEQQASTAFSELIGNALSTAWRSNSLAIWAGIAVIAIGQIMIALAVGRYELSASGGSAWRIDKLTGQVSYCASQGIVVAPFCGPWGARAYPPPPTPPPVQP